jgi:hypothetical protein
VIGKYKENSSLDSINATKGTNIIPEYKKE